MAQLRTSTVPNPMAPRSAELKPTHLSLTFNVSDFLLLGERFGRLWPHESTLLRLELSLQAMIGFIVIPDGTESPVRKGMDCLNPPMQGPN